jgi:hypothetical protein
MSIIKTRNRVKQTQTLQERLRRSAQSDRECAARTPPGEQREQLLRRARESEIAASLDAWIASPGLRSPE